MSWRSKASWFSGRWRSSRGAIGTRAWVGPSLVVGIRPPQRRADDSGCPEGRRGGERRRACATKLMHPTQAREIVACARQTRPSLGPSTRARRSSLCTWRESASWWGDRSGITVGQTHASGRNQHWGRTFGRSAARRVSPLSQGRGVARREKEGGRGLRPCEDQESRLVARTSCSVAEVCRRPLVSNKLGIRVPKRTVRVE